MECGVLDCSLEQEKGTSVPERGEGKGMKPSSPGRRAPASALFPSCCANTVIFYTCHGGIEAAQRPKTRPMANLSINPAASILQTAGGQGQPLKSVTPTRLGLVCSTQTPTPVDSSLGLVLSSGDSPELTKTSSVLRKALG